jgi:aminocarboxymuconate-semialdehyde decarboxylase
MASAPSIDIHAHYYPDTYLRLIAEEGSRFGARYSTGERGPVIDVGVLHAGPLARKFTDLELRIAEMDDQGVRIQALSLTQPMVYWADGALGARLSAAFNDALVTAHEIHPERLIGFAILPMQDPDLAVAELERVAELPGIKGIYCATRVLDRELSDPVFFPIYERIEEFGLPVFLHPLEVIGAERLTPYFLANLLGNPFDTAVAAAHLIFGGVLDRFPDLDICLPHAGGAFPYLVGRLNHGWKVREECRHLAHGPETYLGRFYYDTISHSAEALEYLISRVGAERVMVGSDYCIDMGYEQPVRVVTEHPRLSEPEKALILGGNARQLLGL